MILGIRKESNICYQFSQNLLMGATYKKVVDVFQLSPKRVQESLWYLKVSLRLSAEDWGNQPLTTWGITCTQPAFKNQVRDKQWGVGLLPSREKILLSDTFGNGRPSSEITRPPVQTPAIIDS